MGLTAAATSWNSGGRRGGSRWIFGEVVGHGDGVPLPTGGVVCFRVIRLISCLEHCNASNIMLEILKHTG